MREGDKREIKREKIVLSVSLKFRKAGAISSGKEAEKYPLMEFEEREKKLWWKRECTNNVKPS